MSTVFYRKWRPNRFSHVVGQSHVTDTLRRAVMSDRVAHAYLFTGPRGVGKTSTARILAKALNSELDQHGDPLPDTPTSIAIDEGRYMDLIEIDAASNRGIDDIRALRDRVLLRPVQGRFKVYIIDEVHMLTDAAFNALLKTLEEPPPQVVMILATTDIHKVPATIISRCQRFDFRRLTPDDVIGRLIEICDVEEIECQPEVLELVATSAWGSLRDAENLIEQLAISYGGGGAEITESQARELLGMGDASAANELATAILSQDAKKALEIIGAEASRGAELKGLRDSTLSAIRAALLMKHGVQNTYGGDFGIDTDLGDVAKQASVDQIMHAITILGKNERFGEASSPLSLEVASLQAVASPVVQPQTQQKPETHTPSPAPRQAQRPPTRSPEPSVNQSSPQPSPQTSTNSDSSDADQKWGMLLSEIQAVTDRRIRTIFVQVTPDGPNNGILILRPKYENSAKRLLDTWRDENVRNQIRPAFQKVYGQDIRVQLGKYQASSGEKPKQSPTKPSNNITPPSTENTTSIRQQSVADDTPASVVKEAPSTSLPPEIDNDPVLQVFRSNGATVISVEDATPQND